jgi:hypothetical protein
MHEHESTSAKPEVIETPKDVAKMSKEKTEKLILLRAANKSLSSIAKELHIAKSTVCNAVKFYENEIAMEMYNIAEEFKEKFKISSERKLAKYMELLDKAYEEFEKREFNFSDLKDNELEQMISHLESKIQSITDNYQLKTGIIVEGESPLQVFEDKSHIKLLNFKL